MYYSCHIHSPFTIQFHINPESCGEICLRTLVNMGFFLGIIAVDVSGCKRRHQLATLLRVCWLLAAKFNLPYLILYLQDEHVFVPRGSFLLI